jgi:hypothetical protein
MKLLAFIGALCFLAACIPAKAQITVSAQTARSTFLLYERVDLLVTIVNIGDTDLLLNNDADHPWLSFVVSHHVQQNYMPVRQERAGTFASLTLKAGETKTLRVNVTPLFTFREEGDYRVSAVVDLPGQGQIESENVPFSVVKGQNIWSQVRPVDGSERTYTLLRFSPTIDTTELYLRVEDPDQNLVYANVGLGAMASSTDPEIFFDPQGNIHILHPTALGTYLYTRADPDGKIIHQGVFKTVTMQGPAGVERVPPRLGKMDDGNVTVLGGQEQDLNHQREKLSEGQPAAKITNTNISQVPDTGTK